MAKAYLDEEGGLLLEEVAFLKVDGGKLHLRTIFGEQKELKASIKEIDFQNSKILLESLAERRAATEGEYNY